MGRKAKELRALEVRELTAPGMHAVGVPAGLYLHVSDSGARSWILRKLIGGRRRDMGLGGFPDVPLVQCAALFCTYPAVAARAALARVTLAKMSLALAVQMNGLGSML
jgi:hypothetical protein